MAPPTGMVTFLFTDVERSARLWEQSPDAMRDALTRHDALAADHVGAHEGLLIKSRGEGDSLFAVFAAAPDAVRAACAFGQALASEAWPAEAALRVRMALHTGEADLRERDYYGVTVNRCARLRALAHGGQILLSSLTRSLVHEALPEGAALVALGTRKLRDLAQPEYVYQLTHPALPAPLSAPSAEETAVSNPAHFLTSLVQRETDLAEVKAFLANAHQNVRSPFGRTGVFQALREANQAGLEGVRRVLESEQASEPVALPTDYDSLLEAVLMAHPAPDTVSRLDLFRALAGGGLAPWEAKRIVDDFCRRRAPDAVGYDGGLLKSLTGRVRRREPP
ncbi:MAG: adenylate/guanylate cyclase domain-containing protein, partial [Armatimonadota bacterium]|nr:adenylate/guanylate cyclase domain-containing protein [Armatimonadota bacterium]